MNDIRNDGIVGKLEDIGTTEACIEFSEWHSKQGLDLFFYGDIDDLKKISLTKDELHALCLALTSINYVDMQAVMIESKDLLEKIEKRKVWLEDKKSKMATPHFLTGMGDTNLLSEDLEMSEKEELDNKK
jgi:hypothetical protein